MSARRVIAVLALIVGIPSTVVLCVAGAAMVAVAIGASNAAAACGYTTTPADQPNPPTTPSAVPGFTTEQVSIAATIREVALRVGAGEYGAEVGITAALGESGLTNVNHGDAVGPDSTGILQQRNNWGPRADRMNPAIAAQLFYTGGEDTDGHGPDGREPGLLDQRDWASKPMTAAIHAVQHNADPDFYARFQTKASVVYAAVSGKDPALVAPGGGCTNQAPISSIQAAPGGWVAPAAGRLSSGFSPNRRNPVTHVVEAHNGQDIANSCGTPIYAAAAGTVISSGPASGYGNWIRIEHAGGIVTVYGHMKAVDLLVRVGQPVDAGQQISRIGKEGQATGCHLHVQVEIRGTPVDPVPFFAQHGVNL